MRPLSSVQSPVVQETAKAVIDNILSEYKSIHMSDDTVKVLQAFLDNLSGRGLLTLRDDIFAVKEDPRWLRQLRNFLVDAILKPSMFTPQPPPPTARSCPPES